MTVFSTVQAVQLKTVPQMHSKLIFLTLTHMVCNVSYHMLDMALEVTCSVLKHAWYLMNRLLNTVPSYFLEIAGTVCLW